MRSIGALDVALAKADYDKARAELKIASLNVERCSVKAPYDGTVVQLLVNQFESVDLRRNLIEIVSSSDLEIEVIAPADWLKRLTKGQNAKMEIDELGVTSDVEVLHGRRGRPSQPNCCHSRSAYQPTKDILPGMSGVVRP